MIDTTTPPRSGKGSRRQSSSSCPILSLRSFRATEIGDQAHGQPYRLALPSAYRQAIHDQEQVRFLHLIDETHDFGIVAFQRRVDVNLLDVRMILDLLQRIVDAALVHAI